MILKNKLITFLFFSFLSFGSTEDISIEEKKMRELASELRCVVCQNQSLLESDSEIAKDLKDLIVDMYQKGKNNKEIKEFLVERYGEFILFRPTMNNFNFILWLAPLLSFLLVTFLALRNFKNVNKKK